MCESFSFGQRIPHAFLMEVKRRGTKIYEMGISSFGGRPRPHEITSRRWAEQERGRVKARNRASRSW
jgi:hypothetical protein